MLTRFVAYGIAFALLGLSGCNTMHGFGQDIEKTGEKVQEKSKR